MPHIYDLIVLTFCNESCISQPIYQQYSSFPRFALAIPSNLQTTKDKAPYPDRFPTTNSPISNPQAWFPANKVFPSHLRLITRVPVRSPQHPTRCPIREPAKRVLPFPAKLYPQCAYPTTDAMLVNLLKPLNLP